MDLPMSLEHPALTEKHWTAMAEAAWSTRDRARVHGVPQVGAAVLSAEGEVFAGCNVEHRFRSHDVHAEVNALTTMGARGTPAQSRC
jgi:cytidine deaminase